MAPANTPLPKNWPTSLPYLENPAYSRSLTPAQLAALTQRRKDAIPIPPHTIKGPSRNVKITPITSPGHPACGQFGLFATKDLKPNTLILCYAGEIHGPAPDRGQADPHARSDYDLSLDRELGLGIDAARAGNEARFINDYRGIRGDGPNAEFRLVWDEGRRELGMSVWVLPETKKDRGKGKGIRKGEEILVSYGRGFWGARRTETCQE